MATFSLWFNGREVINIDTIERIEVKDTPDMPNQYALVTFVSGNYAYIAQDHYRYLMEIITKEKNGWRV